MDLLGEDCCWSVLGLKGIRSIKLQNVKINQIHFNTFGRGLEGDLYPWGLIECIFFCLQVDGLITGEDS